MPKLKEKKLACGAVGCCHVGYPHHHCENCGQTVYDYSFHQQPYWYSNGWTVGGNSTTTDVLPATLASHNTCERN